MALNKSILINFELTVYNKIHNFYGSFFLKQFIFVFQPLACIQLETFLFKQLNVSNIHYININTNYNFIQLPSFVSKIDDIAEKKIQTTR